MFASLGPVVSPAMPPELDVGEAAKSILSRNHVLTSLTVDLGEEITLPGVVCTLVYPLSFFLSVIHHRCILDVDLECRPQLETLFLKNIELGALRRQLSQLHQDHRRVRLDRESADDPSSIGPSHDLESIQSEIVRVRGEIDAAVRWKEELLQGKEIMDCDGSGS